MRLFLGACGHKSVHSDEVRMTDLMAEVIYTSLAGEPVSLLRL